LNKVLVGNKNGENRLFLRKLVIETIEGWKTFPSKSSFYFAPLVYRYKATLSQNSNWLSVNFSIYSFFVNADTGNIIRRETSPSASFAMFVILSIYREGYLASFRCNFRFFLESVY